MPLVASGVFRRNGLPREKVLQCIIFRKWKYEFCGLQKRELTENINVSFI